MEDKGEARPDWWRQVDKGVAMNGMAGMVEIGKVWSGYVRNGEAGTAWSCEYW